MFLLLCYFSKTNMLILGMSIYNRETKMSYYSALYWTQIYRDHRAVCRASEQGSVPPPAEKLFGAPPPLLSVS